MHGKGYSSWVCLSVSRHLTSGVSVRPENDTTYSMGNEGQKICVDFSETTPLQRYSTSCIVWPFWKPCMRINSVLIARAFSKIRACVVPRVLHLSVTLHH